MFEQRFQLFHHWKLWLLQLLLLLYFYCFDSYSLLCCFSSENDELKRKTILRVEYEMNIQAVHTILLVEFVSIPTTFLERKEMLSCIIFKFIVTAPLHSPFPALSIVLKGTLFSFTTLLIDEIMCVPLWCNRFIVNWKITNSCVFFAKIINMAWAQSSPSLRHSPPHLCVQSRA